MKKRFKLTVTILISIMMIFTYMVPGSVFADSDAIAADPVIEDAAVDEDVPAEGSEAEQPSENGGEPAAEIEEEPAEEPENEQLSEGAGETTPALKEEPVKREGAKASGDLTVLAFTSDVHNGGSNANGNQSANRMEIWLNNMINIYGKIDVMSFCGDMGSAGANESQFWTFTKAVMDVVDDKGITQVHTTGNHEFMNGNFDSTSSSVKDEYIVGAQGISGDNYIIYCLGTDNWNNYRDNYTAAQIEALSDFLEKTGNDKPIIILTHFPLHHFSSRTTTNASQVIDVLNNASAAGKKIILLWGHNHSVSDTYYDAIYSFGDTLEVASNSNQAIDFYYGAAGCMSDSENGTGSAFVKGKGLIITIDDENKMSFTYYDENANNVTEGGTFTEQDPVSATGISVSPKTLKVEAGSSKNLTVNFVPEETTNRKVTWTSSDTSVATVSSSGQVTGVAKGTATITATYVDGGFTDTCEVTVTKKAGSGVTPEPGKKYVILAGDGYALTSEGQETGYSNGSGDSGSYSYKGLTGIAYTVGDDVIPDHLLWTFTSATRDGNSYYIQSQEGEYLNGTYEANSSGGYDGTLKLDDTPDIWIIKTPASGSAVSGSILMSTNASQSDAGDKYLTHGNGDNGGDNTNIFTLRSEDNATASKFYEYTDEGTYVPDPDDPEDPPVDPPAPSDGNVYKLTDQLEAEKDYLIVSSDSAGTAYALTSPGGTSEGAAMGNTSVTIQSGDLDGDGTADKYISLDEASAVWTTGEEISIHTDSYGDFGKGFDIGNVSPGGYLEGKGGDVKVFSELEYVKDTDRRGWQYTEDKQLQHVGGRNTYIVYYEDGFKATYNSTSVKTYLYEKFEAVQGEDPVESVELNKDELTLTVGETEKLTATVKPQTAADKTVTWSSDNEDAATVDQTGLVTAVGEGTSVITVTTNDGKKEATCTVTVEAFTPPEGSVYKLTDQLKAGKDYLIVSSDSAGSAYALTSPGGTSGGAAMGRTSVAIQSGDLDGDGTADLFVSNDEPSMIWSTGEEISIHTDSYGDFGKGFDIGNVSPGGYLEGKGGDVKVFSELEYVKDTDRRGWQYSEDKQLRHVGGRNTYVVYYEDGFKATYNSTSAKIYLYEKVTSGDHEHSWDEGTITTQPTCTEDGVKTFTCTECGETKTEVIEALGHDWSAPTYSWSDDNSRVTAIRTCKHDTSHMETETADTTSEVTKAPTCETKGETTYTAEFENTAFEKQISVVEDIPATGHDWGEPTYEWSEDLSSVTATRVCKNDASHVETETADATYAVTKAATCTSAGEGTWTSKAFANEAFSIQTQTVTIEATGHKWSDPAYVWAGNNKSVTATRTCINDPGHVETETAHAYYEVTTPATATTAGTGTWTSAAFINSAFEVQVKTVEIPAYGYRVSYEWDEDFSKVTGTAVPYNPAAETITETVDAEYSVKASPTCTTTGIGLWISDSFESDQFTVQRKEVTIAALGHDLTEHPAVSETCTEQGSSAYWSCSRCGKFFGDSSCNTEINEGSWIIPAKGHDWGAPTYTWSVDNKSVTAIRICGNDASHFETETVSTTYEVTKPATCEAKGETTYTASFINKAFAVQTRTVEDIQPKGHDWGAPTYTWSADNQSVTAIRICKNDAAHYETETKPAFYSVITQSTCEEEGVGVWTSAEFENKAFKVQSKNEPIAENGHDWDEGVIIAPSTCSETGIKLFTCSVCGKTMTEDIPIDPEAHDWGKATYSWTDDNSTAIAIRKCRHDHKHVEVEEAVVTKEVTKPAACETVGETTYTAIFTNSAFAAQTKTLADIEATGHKLVKTEAKAASCKEDGNTEYYTCSACGKHFSDEAGTEVIRDGSWIIEATGHDWNEPTYYWTKENSRAIAIRTCNNDPGHVESEVVDAVSEIAKPAGCETKGETTYTAEFANEAFEKQIKTIADIDPLSHDYAFSEWRWNEDKTEADAVFICSICGNEKTITVSSESSTVKPKVGIEGIVSYTAILSASDSPDGQVHTGENAATLEPLPARPALSYSAKYTNKTIKLKFTAENAVKYKVAYKNIKNSKWTYVTTAKTSYTLKGLKNKGFYLIKVAGINSDGKRGSYTKLSRHYIGQTTFKATALSKGTVKITAQKPSKVKGITGYSIRYSLKKNMSGSETVTVKTKKDLAYTLYLESGKKYWIEVSAIITKDGSKYYAFSGPKKAVKVK